MRKLYCDRCGKEADELFNVAVPKEKMGDNGNYKVVNFEVCESCHKFVMNAKREYDNAMVKVRIAFYKTLFPNE